MLKLVPYQPAFLDAFIHWREQPLSLRHNPLKTLTVADIKHMLESEGSDFSDFHKHKTFRWFIERDGEPVGSVSVKGISHQMNYADIGYGIAPEHHNRGIATEAVGLLIRNCFTETPLRKLLAYAHDENAASIRVLQKLGFTQEGLLREHYIINDKPVNELLFGLLKHEWKLK
jgi:ribosomal-protein-alanine N-acetyltransferase